MDELVDGYSQFTALADEASKGVSVDGVRDPLGRSTTPPPSSSVETPTTAASATGGRFGSPGADTSRVLDGSSSRRLPSPGAVFGGGTDRAPVFAAVGSGLRGVGTGGGEGRGKNADPIQDPVARDALKLLFSKEGNYVQVGCMLVLLPLLVLVTSSCVGFGRTLFVQCVLHRPWPPFPFPALSSPPFPKTYPTPPRSLKLIPPPPLRIPQRPIGHVGANMFASRCSGASGGRAGSDDRRVEP